MSPLSIFLVFLGFIVTGSYIVYYFSTRYAYSTILAHSLFYSAIIFIFAYGIHNL